MCTVTLELSDELAAVAEKQGLLSPSALETYIRKSLDEAGFPAVKGGPGRKAAMSPSEARQKLRGLGKDTGLTVDRFLEMKHSDKELEDRLDPWITYSTPAL
jgi:hypothetical protein